MKLAFLGDVHGFWQYHLDQTKKFDYTIQIGDLGFRYDYLNKYNVNSSNHKFLGGNHDNYDLVHNYPHYLGDFGIYEIPNFGNIFFMRGGFSIDYKRRQEIMKEFPKEIVWWSEEELSYDKRMEALELYKLTKPNFVISHECPYNLVQFVSTPGFPKRFGFIEDIIETRTNSTLQKMFDYHEPKEWLFGHFHKSWSRKIGKTQFQCLDINEVKVYEF